MNISPTTLPGVLIIEPEVYRDERGWFLETYHCDKYEEAGLSFSFVQDNCSSSVRGTLRGLHAQVSRPQGKLVRVTKGEIFDVAVDLRKKSSTFGKYFSINLSEKNGKSIFIPAGFAHGFIGLKKENIVYYFCTNYRSAANENGINWFDKDLKIKWPIKKPIVSSKDKKNISFKDYVKKFIK